MKPTLSRTDLMKQKNKKKSSFTLFSLVGLISFLMSITAQAATVLGPVEQGGEVYLISTPINGQPDVRNGSFEEISELWSIVNDPFGGSTIGSGGLGAYHGTRAWQTAPQSAGVLKSTVLPIIPPGVTMNWSYAARFEDFGDPLNGIIFGLSVRNVENDILFLSTQRPQGDEGWVFYNGSFSSDLLPSGDIHVNIFANTLSFNSGARFAFDALTLSYIPEPSSTFMLMMGAMASLTKRKRAC